MNELKHKSLTNSRRAHRVRAGLQRASGLPRLSVYVSSKHITAQIIDDSQSKTLAYATSIGAKDLTGNLTGKAEFVGGLIAKNAKKAKVTKVAFDRGSRLYHGRVKALADAARAGGLEI